MYVKLTSVPSAYNSQPITRSQVFYEGLICFFYDHSLWSTLLLNGWLLCLSYKLCAESLESGLVMTAFYDELSKKVIMSAALWLQEAEMEAIKMQTKLDSIKEEKERLLNSLVEAE